APPVPIGADEFLRVLIERCETTMTLFGPRYHATPKLQAAINHAERAGAMLADMVTGNAEAGSAPEGAVLVDDLWLCGRSGEIEAFVADVVAEQSSGLGDDDAARAIETFLDEHVHHPLRDRFRRDTCCCKADKRATVARVIGIVE